MAERTLNTCIVGIGASAGGIESLREFFAAVPSDTGLAFIVIQHLNPQQPSQMAALLAKCTAMSVMEAEDGATVTPNHVYTIPPGKFISTEKGKLHLTDAIKRDGLRMPIDFFFRSLAEDQREHAIAVLFSGSGSDGTLGIREIHGMGGCVLVQDPATAQFDSMIENALATGMVDRALLVREIPAALLSYVNQHRAAAERSPADDKTVQEGLTSIIDLLASQNKGNFHGYKPPTLQRRIQRRMGLNQIDDISDYYRFLSEQPAELAKLSQDMLIGVTSFFRDPEAFEELRDKVIGPLVQEKNNIDPVRAWIAGCATGEEAYSIVMLLMEEMARARKTFGLQIFATDIDAGALRRAREGIYPQSIVADLTEERLARFFFKQDGTYQIVKQVRECVTFALHNVISDPPFFNLDLLSCRNLLIYIQPEMQKKILSLFAFALKPGSCLYLGKSENPMEQNEIFEPISNSMRVFRRRASYSAAIGPFALRASGPAAVYTSRAEKRPPTSFSELNQQVLLDHFHASIVLADEKGEIHHFYGPTYRYLSHPSGDPSMNLFDMTDDRHKPILRLALERAAREKNIVKLEALEFDREGEFVNVTITPVVERESNLRLFAVIFEPARDLSRPSFSGVPRSEHAIDPPVIRLEAENKALRAELQATSDGFQAAHEELTAANEEVMAINEELQSTNEELVTSKEELQSLNEELVTTNTQLNDKMVELGKVNDDLANFFNSSEVATIFLDRKFHIRRFTPSATKLMNLLPQDLGRPVDDISNKFLNTDLTAIADGVLKSLVPVDKDTQSADGFWHTLRCMPYRTAEDLIDGVVFTFVDVTRLKRSEEAMTTAKNFAESIIHTTRESLLVLDPDLRVVSANPAFYETFGLSPADTENQLIYELGNRLWNIPRLRELLEEILPASTEVKHFEVARTFPKIGPKVMSLNARAIFDEANRQLQLILLAIDDITEDEARARLAAVVESSDDAIVGKNLDGIIMSWNAGAERLFGYSAEEMIGQSIMRIVPPGREEEEEKEILRRLRRGERVEHFETMRIARDQRPVNVSLTISPIKDAKGNVIGASKVARDISERNRLEQQRQELSRELEKQVFERTQELRQANRTLLKDIEEREKLEEQLRQSQKLESMGVLAAGVAHDLNNLLNIIQGYISILDFSATREEIKESIEAITETTLRGAVLVQQLLSLARKAELKVEPVDVNKILQGLNILIAGSFPKNIETSLNLAPTPLTIMADAGQITQVLLNLCVNARDAMPDGGDLELKTSIIDGKDIDVYEGLQGGDWFVFIEITDTGTGMDEDTQNRIFEPFFTTKEVGKGTGLGLAVVYGIVKSHNGFIKVKSQPLQGTTFRLYFPAVASTG